jgi:hypothetical protein
MTGSKGTEVAITGTSFIGTDGVTLCSASQTNFSIINDTQIRLTVSDLGATASKPCDLVVTNPIGKSSTSSDDVFNYAPQDQGGGTTHAPSAPTISNKAFYIALAGIGAVALIAVAGLMRRWNPGKKKQSHLQVE